MLLPLLLLALGMQPMRLPAPTFYQDIGTRYTQKHGLPANDVRAVAVSGGAVWAGTARGIARLQTGKAESSVWRRASALTANLLIPDGSSGVIAATSKGFFRLDTNGKAQALTGLEAANGKWVASSRKGGFWCLAAERLTFWKEGVQANYAAPKDMELDYVVEDARGRVFVGARRRDGGYSSGERGTKISYIRQLLRLEGDQLRLNNAIKNSRGRSISDELQTGAMDGQGHLWIGTLDGLVVTDGAGWWLGVDGRDGLPFAETRVVTAAPNGDLWTGTDEGACRLRDGEWRYFRGKRWLPGNQVRAIAPDGSGGAWLATDGGVGHIESVPMTLAQKAAHYEQITAARHNRNGYVTICNLADLDDLTRYEIEASDNDGLWTAVYAAAECFRYAVTKEPEARALAQKSMRAILDLERLTGIPGFPARAVIRKGEKNVFPLQGEWHPSSVDPQVEWKGDTSSDELDGHYFIYPIFYDLVADAAEKAELRAALSRITDHLLRSNYRLIDLDGKPTRWAIFNPENLNENPEWEEERGLNSLSMLAYLKVTYHVTGDEKYQRAYRDLIEKHHYLLNTLFLKQLPPYSINHSDDQLAFLGYYSLLRYETDPEIRRILLMSLERSWQAERPERSPLFDFIYGALTGKPCDTPEAVQTLQEWPWDLRHWTMENHQRSDITLSPHSAFGRAEATRVLPHSERRVMQWSDNPYILDGGDNRREYDGAAFLLPYWLARYHKLLTE